MAVVAVCGLGYGDEGKGAIVDTLARSLSPASVVVRFNGGGQAAHNVYPQHSHHTFSQLGSGSFQGCHTHLSKDFLFNPVTFLKEVAEWKKQGPVPRVTIDPMAKIVTPYHMAANAAREDARGTGRHGSCAQGIGETMTDSLEDYALNGQRGQYTMRAGVLEIPDTWVQLLSYWRGQKAADIQLLNQPVPSEIFSYRAYMNYVRDFAEVLDYVEIKPDRDVYNYYHNIIFEGAQGVLLDEDFGFHPHTTWSHSTLHNITRIDCERNMDIAEKIGVTRTYMTRHGAGPFVTEDPAVDFPEPNNGTGTYQGAFRKGHLDLVALKYAILVSGVNSLAVNHLDYLMGRGRVKVCVGYDNMDEIPVIAPDEFGQREKLTRMLFQAKPIYDEWPARAFLSRLEHETGLPVRYIGWGLRSHGLATDEGRVVSGQDGYDPFETRPHHSEYLDRMDQV